MSQYADVSLRGQTIEVLPKGRMGSTRGVLRDQITRLEAVYTVHVTAPAAVKLTPLTTKCRMDEIVDVQVRAATLTLAPTLTLERALRSLPARANWTCECLDAHCV